MAASCALSAPSSFLAHQPLYQNKPNKRLTPCLPSPRAVALRVSAAKLPPGVSDTSGEKNASGYCKRLVQRVSTVSCSFSVVFRLKCPGCSQSSLFLGFHRDCRDLELQGLHDWPHRHLPCGTGNEGIHYIV